MSEADCSRRQPKADRRKEHAQIKQGHMHSEEHPFYGQDIYRDREQRYIEKILQKYRHESVSEELKEKIWNELQREKHLGNVTIPFKVVMRRDPSHKFPEYVEVILDTKI